MTELIDKNKRHPSPPFRFTTLPLMHLPERTPGGREIYTEKQLRDSGFIDSKNPRPEHPNKKIRDTISGLADLFVQTVTVGNRFQDELNQHFIDNSEDASLFLNFANSLTAINTIDSQRIDITTILGFTDNPHFRELLGNTIARTQIADQYVADRFALLSNMKKNILGFKSITSNDELSFVLMDNLFHPNPLVLVSIGSQELGKTVTVVDTSQEEARVLLSEILNPQTIEQIITSISAPTSEYLQAKNGRIRLKSGAHKLLKKLDHSLSVGKKFQTNFNFSSIAATLGISVERLGRNYSSQLDVQTCQQLEQSLDEYAKSLIIDIISNPQTILIRDRNIEIINALGQGIKFKKALGPENQESLIGFIDTQSILVIPENVLKDKIWKRRKQTKPLNLLPQEH